MKIGDKVRFLNEVGEGKVSGFKSKNIVLIEDADGFEIPMQTNEVIVVNEDKTINKIISTTNKEENDSDDKLSIKARLSANKKTSTGKDIEPDYDPADNFNPIPKERKEGEKLNIYLAFVPKNIDNLSKTDFNTYIVNDSNYYIHYVYMVKAENDLYMMKSVGEIEPNTKLYIESFTYDNLNNILNTAIQLFGYKIDKPFSFKDTLNVKIKIDGTKFYRLTSFLDNDFFDQPAILYPITEKEQTPTLQSKVLDDEHSASLKELKDKFSLSENQVTPKATVGKIKKHNRSKHMLKTDKIVVDLHADSLLETTLGMSSKDILEYQLDVFRSTLNEYKAHTGQKIIFIHGKGEGVLRHALITELNHKYKNYYYQDASFREYGYGATQVTITNK